MRESVTKISILLLMFLTSFYRKFIDKNSNMLSYQW